MISQEFIIIMVFSLIFIVFFLIGLDIANKSKEEKNIGDKNSKILKYTGFKRGPDGKIKEYDNKTSKSNFLHFDKVENTSVKDYKIHKKKNIHMPYLA